MSESGPRIVLSQSEGAPWETKGLRGFLEYRDLGVARASEGRFSATIARALHAHKPGADAPMHVHRLGFHLMFIIKGWVRCYYDGLGEVMLRAGDCVTYEGEVPQAHIEYSADYEVLQVTMPAEFQTAPVPAKT